MRFIIWKIRNNDYNMNAINIQEIKKESCKLGKIFSYGDNYQLINIYHNNTRPVIYSPTLYIPNGLIYFNDDHKPLLEMTLENERFDPDITIFKNRLQLFEHEILDLVKLQYPELKESLSQELELVSVFKPTFHKSHLKLMIPINKTDSKCILTNKISGNQPSKNKILFNWDIPTPTYGIAIILIKNIWIKNGKYGINLFTYLLQVMPSHILDPPDFMGDMEVSNKTVKISDLNKHIPEDASNKTGVTLGNHPDYATYYKMKKMGIPLGAIQNKMKMNGHQSELMNFPEDTLWIVAVNKIMNKDKSDALASNIVVSEISDGKLVNLKPGGLLSQIMNPSAIKLKKVEIKKDDDNKIPSQYRNLRVPSLSDISSALARLRKIDSNSKLI